MISLNPQYGCLYGYKASKYRHTIINIYKLKKTGDNLFKKNLKKKINQTIQNIKKRS